ncbi:PREDICTED: uncharacterized protein LOC105141156 [Populus euphratica]|uniref:Uncharacterized protein LOC105141156 n=1 Tax=Populus euphratica TaxID=75702 RepID=A0AAJ6VDU9_POPEU|nr:PREDICTED: uncharacterized protein LOC105141156 [Populus euphratica]
MVVFNQRPTRMNEEHLKEMKDLATARTYFQDGQVKIIPLPSSQAIRVLAERPHASNRSWFNQDFPVPENCNVNKTQVRFQAGVFIIEVLKATTRQPCPEEETTDTDEAPIRPNLSIGEEGGQEKSTTSQFSEKATTQPNPREGIEEPASIKIEKKQLYRKILRPHKKEVINEESEMKDSEALSPL